MFPRKYRIHAFLLLIAVLIIVYPQYSNKPDEKKVQAATTAAREFLRQVDDGRYEDSWQLSSRYLQETVSLEEWKSKLANLREMTGPIINRERSSAEFTAPAKELPNNEFILLTFEATFEKKPEVKERVTLMLERERGWRVAGYFIE